MNNSSRFVFVLGLPDVALPLIGDKNLKPPAPVTSSGQIDFSVAAEV